MMPAQNTEASLCIHAIVPAGRRERVNTALEGLGGVSCVAAGEFAAIVGEHQGVAHSRADLAPQLLFHQRVLERVMQESPLLPARFDTVVPDIECLWSALQQGSPEFSAAMAKLEGCVEIDLRIMWTLQSVFAEIATEAAVVAAKEEGAEAVGRQVKQSLECRRDALAADITGALRAVVTDLIVYPVTADEVVLELALLLREADTGRLDRCLEDCDAAHEGLSFRCIGPMPPASFASVEIDIAGAAELKRARALLGMHGAADAGEIHTAYRRLVREAHPDAAEGGCSLRMAALANAKRLLLKHGRESEGASLYVAVQRQEPDHERGL